MVHKTAFVLEDSPKERRHICNILETEGVSTTAAGNVEDAFSAIQAENANFDGFLFDMKTPISRDDSPEHHAGLELSRQIVEELNVRPEIIFLMSAFVSPNDKKACEEYGVADVTIVSKGDLTARKIRELFGIEEV